MEKASFHWKWSKLSNTHFLFCSSLAAVAFPDKGNKGEEPSHTKGVRKCCTKPYKAYLKFQNVVRKESAALSKPFLL